MRAHLPVELAQLLADALQVRLAELREDEVAYVLVDGFAELAFGTRRLLRRAAHVVRIFNHVVESAIEVLVRLEAQHGGEHVVRTFVRGDGAVQEAPAHLQQVASQLNVLKRKVVDVGLPDVEDG